jgi:hypothetical protein
MPTRSKSRVNETKELRELINEAGKLRLKVNKIYEKTKYEDLEHAGLGLEIVEHALEEVAEGKGKGGNIESTSDSKAHFAAEALLRDVEKLQEKARQLLETHPNEDLETAIKALEVSKGSLEEVVDRYD